MGWIRRLLNSGAAVSRLERELSDDMTFHRDQLTADLVADGVPADEARIAARRRLGLPGPWVASAVDTETVPWVSTALREGRQALRGLARRAVFTMTVLAALGAGTGALLAAFTVASHTLAPLPFPDQSRLVVLEESIGGESLGGNPARTADWRRALSTVSDMAGLYGEHLVLGRGADAQRALALRGIGPFATTLGVRADRGRTFTEEEQRDGTPVVLLTDAGWARLFGRDPAVIGRAITLRGEPYQVIGVAPPHLDYPPGTDLMAPAGLAYQRAPRGGNWLQVVGRLAPGQSLEAAASEARSVARRLAEANPAEEGGLDVRLTPLQHFETREVRGPVLLLVGVALLVYVVVCINVGGLLLVRTLARDHEARVRRALGAGRWAMARLALLETAGLVCLALPLAVAVAWAILRGLRAALVDDLAALVDLGLGAPAVVAAGALLVLTTGLLAAGPAWHLTTRTAMPRAGGHVVTDAPARRAVRRWLVVGQVACSTLLLVLALLATTSLKRMVDRPRGFESSAVISVRYDLDWEQSKSTIDAVTETILATVEATPGVAAAGVVDRFPLLGGTQSTHVRVFGESHVPSNRPDVSVRSASPGYFAAMRIPLLAGRPYVDGQQSAGRHEVVVNAAFAQRYFGSTDVVQRQIAVDWDDGPPRWLEIVGVIGDVRQGVRDTDVVPEVYRPWARAFWPLLHVTVRADDAARVEPLLGELRARLARVLPDHPIADLAPLDDVLARRLRQPRVLAVVTATCAAAAALLAMLGVYGLLAGEMLARHREVGIRLALGARTWWLRGWMARSGLWMTAVGVVVGVTASVPVARALQSQWFGVHSGDAGVRALAACVLLAAGLLASALPAWRLVGPKALAALRPE